MLTDLELPVLAAVRHFGRNVRTDLVNRDLTRLPTLSEYWGRLRRILIAAAVPLLAVPLALVPLEIGATAVVLILMFGLVTFWDWQNAAELRQFARELPHRVDQVRRGVEIRSFWLPRSAMAAATASLALTSGITMRPVRRDEGSEDSVALEIIITGFDDGHASTRTIHVASVRRRDAELTDPPIPEVAEIEAVAEYDPDTRSVVWSFGQAEADSSSGPAADQSSYAAVMQRALVTSVRRRRSIQHSVDTLVQAFLAASADSPGSLRALVDEVDSWWEGPITASDFEVYDD